MKKRNTELVIENLTRFEALDLISDIQEASKRERFGEVMRLLGMENMPHVEATSLEELAQIASVRMADLCRQAGVTI